MTWECPDPPEDSCFILDKDDQGYPRLSWNLPEWSSRDQGKAALFIFFLTLWILAGLAVIVCVIIEFVAVLRARGGIGRVVLLFIWLVGWSGAAYCLARILQKYLIDPDPESFTFTDTVLKYDPGFSNYHRVIARRAIFIAKKTEIPRPQIREIHLQKGTTTWHWWKPMNFLCIRHDYDELEVGPSLNNSDSEWLAELLKDWLRQEKNSSQPHKPIATSRVTTVPITAKP